jgi:hypothetical protein
MWVARRECFDQGGLSMPTNRRPIGREWKPGRFSGETIELFRRLDHTPECRRGTYEWKADVKRLHIALGEDGELFWLTGLHVTDRRTVPVRADEFYVRIWERAKAMRSALLQAISEPQLTR